MNETFMSRILEIIQEHYTDENFTVEELAREAGLSRSMLHRKLKAATGKSASQTICEYRLNEACLLLDNDEVNISEIAYRVGFNDPSYFSKVFRKHYGLSPGELRKQQRPPGESGEEERAMPKGTRRRSLTWATLVMAAVVLLLGAQSLRDRNTPSLAVLPLRNLTGSAENDYFVAGFHDALVGELSRIQRLRVISTTSTLPFKDSLLLLPEIARQLGVRSIVEGSVTGSGDSLKLVIQLIKVFPKERHLFAREYREPMSEVVNIQKQVARDMAGTIRIRLEKEEEAQLAHNEPVNPRTYKSFLRAMYDLNRGTPESMLRALDTLAGAIHRDPADPWAHAGYALGKAIFGHGANIAGVYFNSAVASAEKALIIDPGNPMANNALALIYLYQFWDWPKADQAFRECLRLQPNNEIAHAHYAWYHVLKEDYESALYHARMSVELNPLSATFKSWYAWVLYLAGQPEEAEELARESLEMGEDIFWATLVMGWVHLDRGEHELALQWHDKLPGKALHWAWFKARTYMLSGNPEKTRQMWEEMNRDTVYWVNPYFKGCIAALLGHEKEARELLGEAIANRYYPSSFLHVNPEVEFLRDYPWYDSLFQQLNL